MAPARGRHYGDGADGRAPARRRGHRGDPPLRGALAGRRVDRGPGALLPRQRRGRDRAARGGPRGRRRALRLLVDRGRLRRPGRARRSPRTRRSGRSTRTARRSARSRGPSTGTAAPTGCAAVSLRYFNVAGATEALGEDHDPETHLIPAILARGRGGPAADAVRRRLPDARRDLHPRLHPRRPTSPTRTCARSRPPARRRANRRRGSLVCNLGNGDGFSNLEVIAAAEAVVGRAIPYEVGPRRPGDPPVLVASAERAATVLGWRPHRPALEEMVGSAWAWRRRHPVATPTTASAG